MKNIIMYILRLFRLIKEELFMPKSKKRILFIVKERHEYDQLYASKHPSTGLKNSALLVNDMLNEKFDYVESKLVTVIDADGIDKEVTAFKPDVVIIEALFVTPAKFAELKPLHSNVRWIVRIHSKSSFLAQEGIAMHWIGDYLKQGIKVAFNSQDGYGEFYEMSGRFHPKNKEKYESFIYLLPNYYSIAEKFEYDYDSRVKNIQQNRTFNVACFGAIRPLKNQLAQAMAAIDVAEQNHLQLSFHMNNRVEFGGAVDNAKEAGVSPPQKAVIPACIATAPVVESPVIEVFIKLMLVSIDITGETPAAASEKYVLKAEQKLEIASVSLFTFGFAANAFARLEALITML